MSLGAPENYRAREIDPHNLRYGQKSDVWSFACICSVAASWVIGGQGRIDKYSIARQQARGDAHVAPIDCFHDDYRVLSVVQEYHERTLVAKARHIDYITPRLWPMVLKKAFSEHIGERSWAEQLHFAMIDLLKPPIHQSPPHTPPEQKTGGWAPLTDEPQDVGDMDSNRYPRPDSQPTRIPRQMHSLAYNSPPLTNYQRSSFDQSLPQASRQSFVESSSREFGSPATSSSPGNSGTIAYENYPISPVRYARGSQVSQSFDPSNVTRPPHAGATRMPTGSRELPNRTQSHSQSQSQSQSHNIGPNVRSRSGVMHYTPGYHQNNGSGHKNTIAASIHEEGAQPSWRAQVPRSREDQAPSVLSEHAQEHSRATHTGAPDPPPNFGVDENCPKHGINGGEVEFMSVQDLLDWYHKKKEVPHAGLKEELKKRDHVFVIDDSISMGGYWPQVIQLFAVLAKFIKECDDDGIELFFTVNRHDKMKAKHTTNLIQKLKSLEGSLDASSEPATVLREIFDRKRCSTLREGKKKFRGIGPTSEAPLTVYILTDGVWQPSTDLWPEISKIVDLLEQEPKKDPKHVGIQFIQFGDDPRMTAKLKAYDNSNLRRDIVDHEPCDGNAWKMLLGSVNTSFDRADAECTCSSQS